MTTRSFELLGQKVTQLIQSADPSPLMELAAFPFTFIEDDFTIVLRDHDDLLRLHHYYAPAVREVETYAISEPSVIPVAAMLYYASFTVNVAFRSGVRLDPSKRVVILGERGGATKALSGLSLLQCSTEWLRDNSPQSLEEVMAWGN